MAIKYTYSIVKSLFEDIGYTIIDSENNFNRKCINYICNQGHKTKISLTKFIVGNRCRTCYGTQKLTIEYVKNELLNKGFTLIDTIYVNATTKMTMICQNGHYIQKTWNTIQQNRGCKICSNKISGEKQKLSYEYVKSEFNKRGFELLDDIYINSVTPLLYKCSCGNISKMNYSNFSKGQHCYNCRNKKLSGENNSRWSQDRTKKIRLNFLKFRVERHLNILIDDPYYSEYILNKNNYHIDHIYPRLAFINNDLDIKYDKKIMKEICNSRENLRIIKKEENLKKHSKYNQEEFMYWFNEQIKNYTIEQ